MNWLQHLLSRDAEARELLQGSARKVIITMGVLYLIWHFILTLYWPEIFTPSLWYCSVVMALAVGLSLRLLNRAYILSQAIWFTGLLLTIIEGYHLYRQPQILLTLAFLPLMGFVMLGLRGTLAMAGLLLGVCGVWGWLPFLPPLPPGYAQVAAGTVASVTALGWGISSNLIAANEASLYHYREALVRLEEARQQRAEISVLLKEQSKATYQLDRLNQMLLYARARAEEAREERDRFAMAVSHELRSPLNYIIGFSDLMVNSPETYGSLESWPAGLYDDIQEVYRSSTHLNSLINDILDMGKIEAQQMLLLKDKVTLKQIIEEVNEMASLSISHQGLWLKVEVEPDLPPVYVDRTRIRQVLINLVTNALHFTHQGGITIRARREGERMLRVEVEDTGAGIAEEDLPKIFTEFRQAGNQNWRRQEGTGLGLAIGRRFIQLHKGDLSVQSTLGKGSIFFFTLPVDVQPVEELELARIEPRQVGRPAQLPLVLFLSTNTLWAKMIGETLNGYKVTLMAEPGQLRQAVLQLYPRVVLVDRQLWADEAVQEFMLNQPYDLPVVAVDIPSMLSKEAPLPEGVVRYLVKPVSRQVLMETVSDLGGQVQTLLVVDDDPTMVRFLMQTLKSGETEAQAGSDYRFITALNGQQALTALHQDKVDAVLLDLDLPDINGLTLLEAIRRDPACNTLPVVIISANDLPSAMPDQKGRLEVALNRPLSRREMVELLNAVLEKLVPQLPPDREL